MAAAPGRHEGSPRPPGPAGSNRRRRGSQSQHRTLPEILAIQPNGDEGWTAADVDRWLESVGVSERARAVFHKLGIDGTLLCEVREKDLAKDLHMRRANERHQLITAIEALKVRDHS